MTFDGAGSWWWIYKRCFFSGIGFEFQFRGGSRTAATSKNERFVIINYYHKALHLGCCSSPRSASAVHQKLYILLRVKQPLPSTPRISAEDLFHQLNQRHVKKCLALLLLQFLLFLLYLSYHILLKYLRLKVSAEICTHYLIHNMNREVCGMIYCVIPNQKYL